MTGLTRSAIGQHVYFVFRQEDVMACPIEMVKGSGEDIRRQTVYDDNTAAALEGEGWARVSSLPKEQQDALNARPEEYTGTPYPVPIVTTSEQPPAAIEEPATPTGAVGNVTMETVETVPATNPVEPPAQG
jgi:hypothetical protein